MVTSLSFHLQPHGSSHQTLLVSVFFIHSLSASVSCHFLRQWSYFSVLVTLSLSTLDSGHHSLSWSPSVSAHLTLVTSLSCGSLSVSLRSASGFVSLECRLWRPSSVKGGGVVSWPPCISLHVTSSHADAPRDTHLAFVVSHSHHLG